MLAGPHPRSRSLGGRPAAGFPPAPRSGRRRFGYETFVGAPRRIQSRTSCGSNLLPRTPKRCDRSSPRQYARRTVSSWQPTNLATSRTTFAVCAGSGYVMLGMVVLRTLCGAERAFDAQTVDECREPVGPQGVIDLRPITRLRRLGAAGSEQSMARTLTDAITRPFDAPHQSATRPAPRCSAKRPVLKSRRTRKRLVG